MVDTDDSQMIKGDQSQLSELSQSLDESLDREKTVSLTSLEFVSA